MSTVKIPKFPRKLEEQLGPDGKDEFIDFLNDSFGRQEEGVVQLVSDRFELRMSEKFADLQTHIDERFFNLQAHTDQKIATYQARTDEKIANLQAHTDEKIANLQAHTDEKISNLQAHTDERISNLQAHTDERISNLQAHTDGHFVLLHQEISGIHRAIAVQTKWILAVVLAAVALLPIAERIAQRLL